MRLSIFCSYSHRDEDFRDELERHVSTFLRRVIITGWHNRRIGPGEEWRGQIDSHLRSAQIILLLVSADFLASDYCSDIEIELALERHAQGEAVAIPIIIRPVDWVTAPFANLRVFPSDGKPVTSCPDRGQVFAEIAIAIRDLARRLKPASPELGVLPKLILTPGLVQMVTILQLNRLELKDMILNEIAENPVLEEAAEVGEELTPAEVESLLEREREAEPADEANPEQVEQPEPASSAPIADEPSKSDPGPFQKIDVDSHFDQYLDLGSRQVEPDVYVTKESDEYIITLNDRDVPQLRLNAEYKHMIDREQEPNKDIRNYVKERYTSALQLIKSIEHRKQTVLRVCQSIVRRQGDFLEHGIDHLKPMMIKDIAEELQAHASTISRAVANKVAHTPQGVFEVRHFFSEALQGPSGNATPLLIVKRRVKKMIEEEDSAHPLTDEQITARLQTEGIEVTRRSVAKYREDMQIPPADERRR